MILLYYIFYVYFYYSVNCKKTSLIKFKTSIHSFKTNKLLNIRINSPHMILKCYELLFVDYSYPYPQSWMMDNGSCASENFIQKPHNIIS